MTLENDVNIYVKEALDRFPHELIRDKKIIHDPIHGTNIFDRHEVALIDGPFFQRLRNIAQNGPTSLVYPSANATRLEHSMGVCIMAGKMLQILRERHPDLITLQVFTEVRIAALLHDISHGPFSHLSEEIMGEFPEVQLCANQNLDKFKRQKPAEMINYLMLTCQAFRDFFRDYIIKPYSLPLDDKSIERIAEMVIGKMTDPDDEYKMAIVNGPFDADKLDYLQRDSYFAGFRSALDVDRLLHSIWVDSHHLKVMSGGLVTLEQILFNKIHSFSRIYHHHKVRAAECSIKGIFEIARDGSHSIAGLDLKNAVDFLKLVDRDILYLYDKPPEVREYLERFIERKLFKRALVISHDTVNDLPSSPGYHDLIALAEDPYGRTRELRSLLVEALDDLCSIYEIWIDIPKSPHTIDSAQALIQEIGGLPRKLSDFFPSDMWLTTYESSKWKGHVFCPADPDIRKKVNKKSIELLSDIYHISFNEKATEWAKVF